MMTKTPHLVTMFMVAMVTRSNALFGGVPFAQQSLSQRCAAELDIVAPNCVTSMYNEVQELKTEMAAVKTQDAVIQQNLENERKTISELRKEVDYLSVRITHGSEYMGTAEVYVRGRWGTICDAGWDQEDANLFCNMMGFESGKVWTPTRSSLPYLMSNMKCGRGDKSIFDCEHIDLSSPSLCSTGHVATVKCDMAILVVGGQENIPPRCMGTISANAWIEIQPIKDKKWPEPAIRVVGGPDNKHGRVEISHRGEWGTICDNAWDDADASVVCRMMGFYDGGRAVDLAVFGPGSDRILLSKVNCTGNEYSILDCSKPYFGQHECTHEHDAGVVCF